MTQDDTANPMVNLTINLSINLAKKACPFLLAGCMVGCQHIQVARSPIPVTLTPNAAQKAALASNHSTRSHDPIILSPTNQPIKNKSDAKKTPNTTEFFLLESWF